MKKNILIALFCSCALLSLGQAQSKPNDSKEPVPGRISFLGKEGDKITVKPKGGGESVNFKVTPETKVTLNGEAKTMAELKKDWKVKVTPKSDDPGTAASVEATKGGKKDEAKDDGK